MTGHKRYLKIVQDHQLEYIKAKKCDKASIAWKIIHMLRAEDPPVRFLQKDRSTGLWNDVGDKKAREKTSQALREHQPFIKAVVDIDEEEAKQPLQTDLQTLEPEKQPVAAVSPSSVTEIFQVEAKNVDLHRSFLASRNEGPMETDKIIEEPLILGSLKALEGSGPNLSDFSVSQCPSFKGLASSRGSGKWEELFDELVEPSQGGIEGLMRESRANLDFPNYIEDAPYDNRILAELEAELENQKLMDNFLLQAEDNTPFAGECLPRPDTIKRETSHQNETAETKLTPPVKRCLLSRDKSEISNKLKQAYLPEFYGNAESNDNDLLALGKALEESFLMS